MAHHPCLYQINTRAYLTELGYKLDRPATLWDIPDAELDRLQALGFDWVWLLGVWQTGDAGRAEALANTGVMDACRLAYPEFDESHICSSPFSVQSYHVNASYGGDKALADLRLRLAKRGLRLMLDFVPNHTARDHKWAFEHPDYYVQITDEELEKNKDDRPRFLKTLTRKGPALLAHGGTGHGICGYIWSDTLQLNYRNPELRQALTRELVRISAMCDGLRCDMAMLPLSDVFSDCWGWISCPPGKDWAEQYSFWPQALEAVRKNAKDFLFMAEVYWGREWELHEQGFDYTYDKVLYDRLASHSAGEIRAHLQASDEWNRQAVRFLENHDEDRAASKFSDGKHQAAAVLAFMIPGMRFFYQGQLEGLTSRVPMQLACFPPEPINAELKGFYERLCKGLRLEAFRDGAWQLLSCREAWHGNPSAEQFIAFSWERATSKQRVVVVVNYGPTQAQCYVPFPWADLLGKTVLLKDLLGSVRWERSGTDLSREGLYLDMPAYGYHVLELG